MHQRLLAAAVVMAMGCPDAPAPPPEPGRAAEGSPEPAARCNTPPSHAVPLGQGVPEVPVHAPRRSRRAVHARWYAAQIHARPSRDSLVIGFARRGGTLDAGSGARGTGCPADMWYRLPPGGYACAARGFRLAADAVPDPIPVADEEPLPFTYGKVTRPGAPIFEAPPTDPDDDAHEQTEGAYFVAITDTLQSPAGLVHQLGRGDYMLAQHVEVLDPPASWALPLAEVSLPAAFVVEEAVRRCPCDDAEPQPCGTVTPRTALVDARLAEDGSVVVDGSGAEIDRAHVRWIEPTARPDGVDADVRWVHVDLSEQALIAYEGDTPVLATLVASGTQGHATPTGLFRVSRKYVSDTMSGPDEDEGSYTVSEVPWTMYYDGDFAIHGAYWHDAFGSVRSHGCINVPPADARWLLGWSGVLPAGWHASSRVDGPWVWITQ